MNINFKTPHFSMIAKPLLANELCEWDFRETANLRPLFPLNRIININQTHCANFCQMIISSLFEFRDKGRPFLCIFAAISIIGLKLANIKLWLFNYMAAWSIELTLQFAISWVHYVSPGYFCKSVQKERTQVATTWERKKYSCWENNVHNVIAWRDRFSCMKTQLIIQLVKMYANK